LIIAATGGRVWRSVLDGISAEGIDRWSIVPKQRNENPRLYDIIINKDKDNIRADFQSKALEIEGAMSPNNSKL
jgi:hypothetical protein